MTIATGLVFLATGAARSAPTTRTNGKVLWTGDLPMGSRSIPAIYETGGRLYLVVSATQPIATG